jgi:hypothetical protein
VEVVQFEEIDQAEAFAAILFYNNQSKFARCEDALAE